VNQKHSAAYDEFLGKWHGVILHSGSSYRLSVSIERNLAIAVDCPDEGEMGMVMEAVAHQGVNISGYLPLLKAHLKLRFLPRSQRFVAELDFENSSRRFHLIKDNPAFLKYQYPRLEANGRPCAIYTYNPPSPLRDGWEVASLKDVGLDIEPIELQIDKILHGAYNQPEAVLIVKNGQLVLEEYFHGLRRRDLHGIQSCTKSVTSIVFGIAKDQGYIHHEQDFVYEYFENRRGYRWIDEQYPIRLLHLLTMTAAIEWNEAIPYTNPQNDNTAMNMSSDWVGYILNKGIRGAQGERYIYTSGMSILLGAIIKNATGRFVDEFANDFLFTPLGINRFYWASAADGTRHTGGGLSLKARDVAKIGALMLAWGAWKGNKIVSSGWVEDSIRQHTPAGDYPYGYQWHLPVFEVNGRRISCFAAAGYGGQWLFMFPEYDLEIVFLAGAYGADSKPYEKAAGFLAAACGSQPVLVQGV
jgi:CubicO group peptidase (beta-lactamase class C family)